MDPARAKQLLEELNAAQKSSSSRYSYMQFKDGLNLIRIIPAKPPRSDFHIARQISYNVGPHSRMIINRAQFKLDCELTKHLQVLNNKGDADSKKQADAMWPKRRILFWALDRNDMQAGPKLVTLAEKWFKMILGVIADPDYGDIEHATQGTDLKLIKTPGNEASPFASYQVMPARDRSPLGTQEQIETWTAEDYFDKYKIGEMDSNEYIQACLAGTEEQFFKDRPQGGSKPSVTAPAAPRPSAPTVAPSRFWVTDTATGEVKEMTAEQLEAMVVFGGTDQVPCMSYDQASGWQPASFFGFALKQNNTPPPTPSAPTPPKSEADLAATLARIKATKGSAVAQDLKDSLKA